MMTADEKIEWVDLRQDIINLFKWFMKRDPCVVELAELRFRMQVAKTKVEDMAIIVSEDKL